MSIPRKHHFVPRSYLAGFAVSRSRKQELHVLDKTNGRQWKSSPVDAGCERDFYTLEVEDDGDPTALETLFSKVDAQGAEAIRAVIENGSIPEGALREKLTNFLGIMAVRVPGILETIDKFTADVMKSLMWQMTASKQAWERTAKRPKSDGKNVSDPPWERMRDFARSGDYEVSMSQNFRMSMLVEMLAPAASMMAARRWTVLRAPAGGPGFICSDRPLTISWTGDRDVGCLPPGFGMPNTIATFPVNNAFALWGVFEESLPACDFDASDVGCFNLSTALFARRFVYSAESDFVVTLKAGTTGGPAEFMAALASARRNAS